MRNAEQCVSDAPLTSPSLSEHSVCRDDQDVGKMKPLVCV